MIDIFMYTFLLIIAVAEIGVTAYLVDNFTSTGFPTSRYRSITNFLLFTACWTAFVCLVYIALVTVRKLKRAARLGTSLSLLILTTLFWLIAAALYTDPARGGRGTAMCWGLPVLDICRKTQAAQALAWTAFVFSLVAILVVAFSDRYDYPEAPTSTTVSVSIVNHRLERGALNSSTHPAQRSGRLNQEL